MERQWNLYCFSSFYVKFSSHTNMSLLISYQILMKNVYIRQSVTFLRLLQLHRPLSFQWFILRSLLKKLVNVMIHESTIKIYSHENKWSCSILAYLSDPQRDIKTFPIAPISFIASYDQQTFLVYYSLILK